MGNPNNIIVISNLSKMHIYGATTARNFNGIAGVRIEKELTWRSFGRIRFIFSTQRSAENDGGR